MATAFQQLVKTGILQLRAEVAAIRLHQAACRLQVHYRPDQPRAASGTPEGGQWIDDPSAATDRTAYPMNNKPNKTVR